MKKKLYIQTYGCQMNQYDSERIAQVMSRAGYVQTDRVEAADLLLLNTCSVRDKAEQKVYSVLGSWKEFKDYSEGVIMGVGGCVAQQEGENLLKRVPHLDLVFGTHNIHKLPEMVEQVQTARARPVEISFYRDPGYMALGPGVTAAATHWLWDRGVRVMGIDAWGWDRPLWMQAQEAIEREEQGIFWAAHQADLPYCQIERLVNLGSLPPTGFQVACFPLRIVGASAAPARVVAITP